MNHESHHYFSQLTYAQCSPQHSYQTPSI
jgi:hypothetical protein